jgi:alkanesulfonate monooxygenase SsuD/methylene tetrahydromethanopterin reductase-like flavin-dependent oxidoreductase (luciferase family)
MVLPLDKHLKIGIQTIHRRTEPATAPWRPSIDELTDLVGLVDRCGYDSLWVGDHVAFAVSILDPLLQLAQAAVVSRRLLLGTNVYLLPLRHPGPVAKQVATLDHLCEGRLIFGVGVGGEFPQEFAVSGVPLNERGGRLTAAIPLLRALWSGVPVSYSGKYFGAFSEVAMQPPPPPRRSPSAMRWISAAPPSVTPRSERPKRSRSASATSGMPGRGMSSSTWSGRTKSGRARSRISPAMCCHCSPICAAGEARMARRC